MIEAKFSKYVVVVRKSTHTLKNVLLSQFCSYLFENFSFQV